MTEYRGLLSGEPREPTWAERQRLAGLKERGVDDVYVEPAAAPEGFWESLVVATHSLLAGEHADIWDDWERELRFATGWPEFMQLPSNEYKRIVSAGVRSALAGAEHVGAEGRLSAIEHLLDVMSSRFGDDHREFVEAVNDRARHFRVGVKLDGQRFIPLTSEHLHQEIVQPTLLLLKDPRFSASDDLYRKAFDRALSGDSAGAVTAATSAVEEMLRAGLNVTGSNLDGLLKKARAVGWTIPATDQIIVKLAALREASDAHEQGTDRYEVAMLAIHLSGTIMLFLADTLLTS